MNEIETEFEAAVATARYALEQFNREPLVTSQRGGARLSPWWRVWVQASEVAQRWHRQLTRDKPDQSPDDSLEQLLNGDWPGSPIGRGRLDEPPR